MSNTIQRAFTELVPSPNKITEIATGFGFTEGPIWHPVAQFLIFSDIQESVQYRWDETDGLSIFRRPTNQANGNCFDLEGRVLSCEHASSQVVRHEHGGKLVRPIATHFEGCALNSPNDIVCDSKGRIWFTDPAYGRLRKDLGILRDQEQPHQGVYRLDPDGSLHLVVSDFQQPNGLCFSEDERQLFVNDTPGGHIRVFDVLEDGTLAGGSVWAVVNGEGEGVPDGMKITKSGEVLCNGPGGVHVFSQSAEWLGLIATPQKSTNFCFGGPDNQSLFITACTSVYRVETAMIGVPMIRAT